MKILLIFIFLAMSAHAEESDRYYCGSGPDAFHPTILNITRARAFGSSGKLEVNNGTPGEFSFMGTEPVVSIEQAKEDLSAFGEVAAIPGAKFFLTGALKFQILESVTEIPGTMSVKQRIYMEPEVINGKRNSGVVIFMTSSQAGNVASKTAEVTNCQRVTRSFQ